MRIPFYVSFLHGKVVVTTMQRLIIKKRLHNVAEQLFNSATDHVFARRVSMACYRSNGRLAKCIMAFPSDGSANFVLHACPCMQTKNANLETQFEPANLLLGQAQLLTLSQHATNSFSRLV